MNSIISDHPPVPTANIHLPIVDFFLAVNRKLSISSFAFVEGRVKISWFVDRSHGNVVTDIDDSSHVHQKFWCERARIDSEGLNGARLVLIDRSVKHVSIPSSQPRCQLPAACRHLSLPTCPTSSLHYSSPRSPGCLIDQALFASEYDRPSPHSRAQYFPLPLG